MQLQKLQDEKAMSVQTEVKQEQPAISSGNLNVIVKKVHGKELRGPPFLSKPEIIIFKVPNYWFYRNKNLCL